jgi:hypothetical protein
MIRLFSIIIVSSLCLFGCASRKGFPGSSEHRKKSTALLKKSKLENKKRFQFLTRDNIRYEKFKPSVPF